MRRRRTLRSALRVRRQRAEAARQDHGLQQPGRRDHDGVGSGELGTVTARSRPARSQVVENSGAPCRTRTWDLLVRSSSTGERTEHHQVISGPISLERSAVHSVVDCDHFIAFRTACGHKIGHSVHRHLSAGPPPPARPPSALRACRRPLSDRLREARVLGDRNEAQLTLLMLDGEVVPRLHDLQMLLEIRREWNRTP